MVTAARLDYQFPTWQLPTNPSDFKKRLVNLINIMQTIGGSTINSITGLFVQIFADEKEAHQYQLAMLAEKTLYWLVRMENIKAKSKRKVDMYELYRTDEEWRGDIGLSKYKLRKLRDKLAPIIIAKSKHNLARTKIMHYKLDGEALLTAIAKVYGRSTIYIRAQLFDRSIEKPHFKQSSPKTLKPDFSLSRETTAKSLTTLPNNDLSSKEDKSNPTTKHAGGVSYSETPNNLNDDSVDDNPLADDAPQVDTLVKLGIWRKVAKKYAWIPENTLNNMIASAKQKQSSGELRNNFPSYLSGVLKNYAQNIREEFQRELAHNPNLKFDEFVLQQTSVGTMPTLSTNQYAGYTWSDFTTD